MATDDDPAPPEHHVRHPAAASRHRRKPKPERDPGLRGLASWPIWVVLLLALLLGAAAVSGAYVGVGELVDVDTEAGITPAQRITAAFAVATAVGVLVALVVNLRKQDVTEQTTRREFDAVFTDRFASAAAQLGGASPAERIAGVYAMAALADEHPTRRQQCVDVLCGYLRLPFDPATDHLADRSTTTTQVFHNGRTVIDHNNPAAKPFDQQVRETITAVIHAHTQPDAHPSWSDLEYHLRGAHLTNLNLARSRFTGNVNFEGGTFSGNISFGGAAFSGEHTLFAEATFSGEHTFFALATFSGEYTLFTKATFSGEHTFFNKATFSGEHTFFAEATFSAKTTSFDEATFSGQRASFDAATFSGEVTSFDEATFSGGTTSFDEATFSGDTTSFDEATFSGDTTSFDEATFSGGTTSFGHEVRRARFQSVQVFFDSIVRQNGAQITGLADPDLQDGATITCDGEPFHGWGRDAEAGR
ncbi:hypothetical protein BJF86_13290 [Serinicoccus sp. CNJ-927]|uniref:pentapeptide repeat-containing protein n=1 Tax=Serinicoccus sp. CNJ-927 TaxID=1904970 RepID=UPI00095E5A80|nr:pentapeptide repeat-containing protein [Serinicoccus sp. CNJ-927]OLT43928.1 hypothetical protein BJF86_13290 [Serinicoccus sp. CNJ-927]